VVRRLVNAGWDVVKINRNNLYETCTTAGGNILNCWSGGGVKHVADLIERARQAQAAGYSRIIAAGQSFGGAISLEAKAKAPDLFYAIMAFSPGHGSDVGNGTSSSGTYYSLDKQLLDVVAQVHDGRLVISLPPGDALSPNRYKDPIGPKMHKVLLDDGIAFVQFDESLPINGHLAATTNQFSSWFGGCIETFVDPTKPAHAGETKCAAPSPVPTFLLPANLVVPTPGSKGAERWLGAWQGRFEGERDIAIVVEKIDGNTATVVYVAGAGPTREFSMGWNRYTNGKIDGDSIKVDRGNGRTLVLSLSRDGQSAEAFHYSQDNKLSATLTRPSGGKL